MKNKDNTLRVADLYHKYVGESKAIINRDTMDKIGLVPGDIIEIIGREKVCAKVFPDPEERSKDLIRIDGTTRNNARVGIDDRVKVRKIEAKEAKRITIAPTRPIRLVGGKRILLEHVTDRPLVKGQKIRIMTMGEPLIFLVISTNPPGAVIATRNTDIVFKEKPIEELYQIPEITYEDIGGLQREIDLVREMIELPLRHPELFEKLGIDPPKGVLLHGPPGTGKTLIAKAVANETEANFISISGPEIISKYYGESEKHIREIFEDAEKDAPSIIFIDEIDSIAPKREEVRGEVEQRVVAQLLALMDGLTTRGQVIVIAATNRPNALDPAIRRGGRFDREIEIGIPDRNGRLEILEVHTRGMPLSNDLIEALDFRETEANRKSGLEELADITHGFVGADIASLCKEAAMIALRKILPEIDLEEKEIPQEIIDKLIVTKDDFYNALKIIEPSAMREVFIEVPQVHWNEIGGLEKAKQELIEAVEWPLKYPEAFSAINTNPPKGIMLFGPPGTGKTLLAKAIATESEANFISIKGPEIMNKYVGESEKAIRETFRKARQAAPTIIFFDEIDSIAPMRGTRFDTNVTERVISQILTEMDGLEELKDIVVVTATNRPDMVDPALLRPGRLDRLIYIPPPDQKGREEIFKIHIRNKPLAPDVNLKELAEKTKDYVGADIEAICREAAMLALRETIRTGMTREEVKRKACYIHISKEHFERAIKRVKPTIERSTIKEYETIAQEFAKYATTEDETKVRELITTPYL